MPRTPYSAALPTGFVPWSAQLEFTVLVATNRGSLLRSIHARFCVNTRRFTQTNLGAHARHVATSLVQGLLRTPLRDWVTVTPLPRWGRRGAAVPRTCLLDLPPALIVDLNLLIFDPPAPRLRAFFSPRIRSQHAIPREGFLQSCKGRQLRLPGLRDPDRSQTWREVCVALGQYELEGPRVGSKSSMARTVSLQALGITPHDLGSPRLGRKRAHPTRVSSRRGSMQ
jgi:hypothetical protein